MAQTKELHVCKCGGDQFLVLQRFTIIGTMAQRGLRTEGPADNPLNVRCANPACNQQYTFDFHGNKWDATE